jgi:hypothetical protein
MLGKIFSNSVTFTASYEMYFSTCCIHSKLRTENAEELVYIETNYTQFQKGPAAG